MARKQGGHRTASLLFPSNWTGRWLRNAIEAEPKWQLRSILNSYKYANWIAFESVALNGLQLTPRGNPENNYLRSVEVGILISNAAEQYRNQPNKIPFEQKVNILKDILATPIVGDMVRTFTEAVFTLPPPPPAPAFEVNVQPQPAEIKEEGKAPVPVITVG